MPTRFESIAGLDSAARAGRAGVRRHVQAAIASLQAAVTVAIVDEAIRQRAAYPLLAVPVWRGFEEEIAAIYADGGPLARVIARAAVLTAAEGPLAGRVLDLARVDAVLRQWLVDYGGRMIREITDSTRAGIVQSLADATGAGVDIRTAARAMLQQSQIGLTAKQQRAFERWRARFEVANADLTAAERRRATLKEFRRRVRDRANTIARTETYNAGNAARRLLWEEAAKQGALPVETYELEWVTRVIRVCPRCQALAGKRAAILGGVFVSDPVASGSYAGQIIRITRPTVHPRCYCALRTVRKAAS